MLLLMLSACSTPPIVNDCQPTAELMAPASNLADLTEVPMTEQEMIQAWLADKAEYKKLQDKDNRLISHIQKFCQNH